MQLAPGTRFSPARLVETLRRSGYRSVTQISEPGDFVLSNNVMDVFIRQFDTGVSSQESRAIRIFFEGDTISSLVEHATASNINQVTVEPLLIGSLQLGPYKDRISLSLHEMPELLIQALLAMEDRKFESHLGVDPRGIVRALWSNLRDGKAVQGGSTLTQQLVKNLFLNPERTISRKAIEALMAVMMELRFSKAEILELYLNEVFLGQSGNRAVHGFALASEYYFGRPVDQLKLHESALLVSIIPAPSYYNPTRHPQRALKRRNLVLQTLADVEAISASTATALSALPLGIIKHKSVSTSDFPAYLDYVHRQLRQYYSTEVLRKNGLKLYTSLDAGLQRIAQQGLSDTLFQLEKLKNFKPGTLQGAVIIVDPKQGEILALVGDRVKGYSGFNRAIDAQRPIGSLVKPAVYLTALKQPRKFSLTTILDDSPLDLAQKGGSTWSPQNYDKAFRGPIPLYQGLIHSYNVPTVRLGLEVGIDNVIETMHQLGIEREIENYPSTLLGANQHSPLEVAQMYQSLANYGVRIPLRSIQTIQNHRSETVARFPVSRLRVVEKNSAYLIDFALKQVVRNGTAAGLSRSFGTGLGLRGKTGTTDSFRDSWFSGYSENLLAVVWVGTDDNRPTKLSGSVGAMRVWENIMSKIQLQQAADNLTEDIVFADIDPDTGQVANNQCPRILSLPYIEGSQPEEFAPCSGLSTQMKSWFSIKRAPSNKQLPVELLPGR
jgi:penicillin-binding protein 1B